MKNRNHIKIYTKNMKQSGDVNQVAVTKDAFGFVRSDLSDICSDFPL